MTIYAVHTPPNPRENVAAAADRCAFVRDGFSWGAFFFGPLWLLRHRSWFALAGWIAAVLALWAASYWLGLSDGLAFLCWVVIALFLGLEGGMLRSAALRRRGFDLADIVSSDRRHGAERIFYTRWLAPAASPSEPPAPLFRPVTPARTSGGERVIGMFPDAEA
jgi:hypothetical protein